VKSHKIISVLILMLMSYTGFSQPEWTVGVNSCSGVSAPIVVNNKRVLNDADDTRTKANSNVISEKVSTFSPFFDNTLIDSFWREYRAISAQADSNPIGDEILLFDKYL
jgi:hypothetical protein